MLFIQFNDNWANEMDITGGKIMTEKEFKEYITAVKKAFKVNDCIEFWIGTNEFINYENFTGFVNTLTIIPITKKEEDVLKHFNLENYGFFPDYIFDEYYEKDEEEINNVN